MAKHSSKTIEYARSLFVEGNLTAKEVSERVGANEKTIGRWREEGNWDKQRNSFLITKPRQLQLLYELLANQTEKIRLRGVENGDPNPTATPAEGDAYLKLTAAIKNLETETSLTDVIDVCIKITAWLKGLEGFDSEKTKLVAEIFDMFIKSQA